MEGVIATAILVAIMVVVLYRLYGRRGTIERGFQSTGRHPVSPRYRNDSGTDGDV